MEDFARPEAAMTRLFAAFAALMALPAPSLAQISDPAAVLRQNNVPSVSFALIRGGRIIRTEALGEQSPGVQATSATLYNIASLTKPLTAEIILRLASAAGTFGLDDPMYPAFVDPDIAADPRNRLLTPRLALTHQTGFPNWRGKDGLKFLRDPGTGYGYSGEGYQYIAHFAEKKTGQSFEVLADQYLFQPDRLQNTSYVSQSWFEGHIATPTGGDGNALKPNIAQHFIAADLVYTTAGDYARFMLSVLKDEGMSKAIASDRIRIQLSQKNSDCQGAKVASCPTDVGPGLGWQVMAFPGHTILMHTGKDPGLFTFAYLDKTTGDGAVILTNGEHGDKIVLPLLERYGAAPTFLAYLRDRAS
jgi:CubicO group peptidase (beta-lactamase class C family)